MPTTSGALSALSDIELKRAGIATALTFIMGIFQVWTVAIGTKLTKVVQLETTMLKAISYSYWWWYNNLYRNTDP